MTGESPLLATLNDDVACIVDSVQAGNLLMESLCWLPGAGGFLGNYLIRTLVAVNQSGLLKKPVSIVAGVRDLDRGATRVRDLLDEPNLRFVEMDCAATPFPACSPVTFVLHAASHASPRHYGSDPVGTILPNTHGTASLLSSNSPGLKRFLFVSSSEIYGSAGANDALEERSPGVLDSAEPRSCYAESKRAGEAICVAWQRQYGTHTVIARPFHTYGPGLAPKDGRVFADFVYDVLEGRDIHINSDGSARRAFCYVADAVAGLYTVMLKGAAGQAYNVGNPDGERSVLELARLVARVSSVADLQVHFSTDHHDDYVPSSVQRVTPNVSKLKALGWRARVSPEDGFKRTLEAHRDSC